jgi:hypothetical protein
MNFSALVTILDVLNQAIGWFLLALLFIGVIFWNSRFLVLSAEKEIDKEKKRVIQEKMDRAAERGERVPATLDPLRGPEVLLTGIGRALFLWGIAAFIQLAVFFVIWWITEIRWFETLLVSIETVRFIGLSVVLGAGVYWATRKYGGGRGLKSILGHLAVLWAGWLIGRWFGIFLIALPLLGVYYYLVYHYAEVILPASDPEDPVEKWQRFKILTWYLWGTQFPIIIVDDQTGMNVETRIEGDAFQDHTGAPGYIWTHMPQAVGLTIGTNFSRVEGPGAIYTKPYERPLDVIDLRTQLRTTEVEAITQDGIPIKAVVFASFCVDRQPWDRAQYNKLKLANPMLQGGRLPDHGVNHFQYSRPRVRAVLSMEGVKTSIAGPVGTLAWRWDEQVMNMVAETARRVLSEIPLSELWLPEAEKDGPGISALDLIAAEISKRLAGSLQEQGVRLFAARVVNYFSVKDDSAKDKFGEFTHQQIPGWRARWEQLINQKLAEAEADAEQKQINATALARLMLLTSIAESLQQTGVSNPEIPRYLVAMRFLGALEDMIGREPELAADEKSRALRERIASFRQQIL